MTRDLSGLDEAGLRDFLDSFDTIICDCDGVLWRGSVPIAGASDFLNDLKGNLTKNVMYITNNSVKTRQENLDKLLHLGFPAQLDHVFHAGYLCALYLKENDFSGKVFVLGGKDAIVKELRDLGIDSICDQIEHVPRTWTYDHATDMFESLDPDVKCVLIGFDVDLTYMKITKAANYLSRDGAVFIVTDRDSIFPVKGGMSLPGTGPLVAAVETASGKIPVVCGKPSPFAFKAVQDLHPQVKPERTLMVGDRADSDILMGKTCGLKTLMVGSGIHKLEDVRQWQESGRDELVADFYVENLGVLHNMIQKLGHNQA